MKTIHLLSLDWWSPHFETDLELIEQHLHNGDDVTVVDCMGKLPCCMRNSKHRLVDCLYCQNRTGNALKFLSGKFRRVSLFDGSISGSSWAEEIDFPASVLDFCNMKYKEFDIGYAVATYWVDQSKNPDFNFHANKVEIRRWLGMAARCFDWFVDFFQKEKPDRVYGMNGRHLQYRAFLNAAQNLGIECKMHERGGDKNRFMLFDNDLPHNSAFWKKLLFHYSEKFPNSELEKVGADFFEGKRKGLELNYKSFVTNQNLDQLPLNLFQIRGRKIAVFLSSEFEFAAVSPEWLEKPYADQNAGILRITREFLALEPDTHFFIRVHPNMSGHNNENLNFLLQAKLPNATVIPPESKVSSYKLLDSCDVALTFGSTMGIEACYWGKASILAGKSYYDSLGAVYHGRSHDEVMGFLTKDCEPKPKIRAVIFGAAMATFGEEFKYVRMETPFKGKFKGQNVNKIGPFHKRLGLKILDLLS